MKLPICRRSRRPRRAGVRASRGVAEAAADEGVLVRGRLLFRQAKLQSSLLERTLPKRSRKLISCQVRAGRVERRLKALRFKARQFTAHVLNWRALLEWRRRRARERAAAIWEEFMVQAA